MPADRISSGFYFCKWAREERWRCRFKNSQSTNSVRPFAGAEVWTSWHSLTGWLDGNPVQLSKLSLPNFKQSLQITASLYCGFIFVPPSAPSSSNPTFIFRFAPWSVLFNMSLRPSQGLFSLETLEKSFFFGLCLLLWSVIIQNNFQFLGQNTWKLYLYQ